MNVRLIKPGDQDQIFECFQSAQVRLSDMEKGVNHSGFYEYDLSYDELKERAQSQFSLALFNDRGEIISYMLGYGVNKIVEGLSHKDSVHEALHGADTGAVYLDQVFLKKGLPIYFAMRLFDSWDSLAINEGTSLVFGAVPHKPWRNVSSERMITYRGFKCFDFVDSSGVTLGLFSKPFY